MLVLKINQIHISKIIEIQLLACEIQRSSYSPAHTFSIYKTITSPHFIEKRVIIISRSKYPRDYELPLKRKRLEQRDLTTKLRLLSDEKIGCFW